MMYSNVLLLGCLLASCYAAIHDTGYSYAPSTNKTKYAGIVWEATPYDVENLPIREKVERMFTVAIEPHSVFKSAFDEMLESRREEPEFNRLYEEHTELFELPKRVDFVKPNGGALIRGANVTSRDAERFLQRCYAKACAQEAKKAEEEAKKAEEEARLAEEQKQKIAKALAESATAFPFLKETITGAQVSEDLELMADFWECLETVLNPTYHQGARDFFEIGEFETLPEDLKKMLIVKEKTGPYCSDAKKLCVAMQERAVNMFKAVRAQILDDLEEKGVKDATYMKNDFNTPEKVQGYMKKHPLDLEKLFGSDGKLKIVQDYHKCLVLQAKSNVDDFNDVVSLYGAVQDAFKALYNLYFKMYGRQPKHATGKFQIILEHLQKFDEYAAERRQYNEKLNEDRRLAAEKKQKEAAEKEAAATIQREAK